MVPLDGVLRRVMRDTHPPGDLRHSEARIAADEDDGNSSDSEFINAVSTLSSHKVQRVSGLFPGWFTTQLAALTCHSRQSGRSASVSSKYTPR